MWRVSQCHSVTSHKQLNSQWTVAAVETVPAVLLQTSASNKGYPKVREDFTITEKALFLWDAGAKVIRRDSCVG